MPVLICITLIVILYIMVVEPKGNQNRPIPYRRLAIVALVGLVISFGILVYLVARYTPVDGAYPGSGNLSAMGSADRRDNGFGDDTSVTASNGEMKLRRDHVTSQ